MSPEWTGSPYRLNVIYPIPVKSETDQILCNLIGRAPDLANTDERLRYLTWNFDALDRAEVGYSRVYSFTYAKKLQMDLVKEPSGVVFRSSPWRYTR